MRYVHVYYYDVMELIICGSGYEAAGRGHRIVYLVSSYRHKHDERMMVREIDVGTRWLYLTHARARAHTHTVRTRTHAPCTTFTQDHFWSWLVVHSTCVNADTKL